MREERSLTTKGMSGPHVILILLACAMFGVCLYLTVHYYDARFADGLKMSGSTICNLSGFWNCDGAVHSAGADIFNIPTSVFGLFFSLILFISSIFPKIELEESNKIVAAVNLLGCLGFFIYSLVALGTMCPMCTIYYVISAAVYFLYHKYGAQGFNASVKILGIYTVVGSLFFGAFAYNVSGKKQALTKQDDKLKNSLLPKYYALKDEGTPTYPTNYKIIESTPNLTDSPIWILAFSDFECPFCAKLSNVLHKFKEKYNGRINIHYYFYPLDNACNKNVKGSFHKHACKASYLAACAPPEKFNEVHDEIFRNQAKLKTEWLDEYAKELGVTECMKKESTKEIVVKMIEEGQKYGVQSTPVMVINGRRLDGLLPLTYYYTIFDDLLSKPAK